MNAEERLGARETEIAWKREAMIKAGGKLQGCLFSLLKRTLGEGLRDLIDDNSIPIGNDSVVAL